MDWSSVSRLQAWSPIVTLKELFPSPDGLEPRGRGEVGGAGGTGGDGVGRLKLGMGRGRGQGGRWGGTLAWLGSGQDWLDGVAGGWRGWGHQQVAPCVNVA